MSASKKVIIDDIQPPQIRAGRALIGWTQDQLAAASGLPKRTIARIELSEVSPRQSTLLSIRKALEDAGVDFIPENGGGVGVRLRKP